MPENAMSPARCEHYLAMMQFLIDCLDPEMYAHSLQPEVIQRAARILKLLPSEVAHIEHAAEPPP